MSRYCDREVHHGMGVVDETGVEHRGRGACELLRRISEALRHEPRLLRQGLERLSILDGAGPDVFGHASVERPMERVGDFVPSRIEVLRYIVSTRRSRGGH